MQQILSVGVSLMIALLFLHLQLDLQSERHKVSQQQTQNNVNSTRTFFPVRTLLLSPLSLSLCLRFSLRLCLRFLCLSLDGELSLPSSFFKPSLLLFSLLLLPLRVLG